MHTQAPVFLEHLPVHESTSHISRPGARLGVVVRPHDADAHELGCQILEKLLDVDEENQRILSPLVRSSGTDEAGKSLDEVVAIAEKFNANMATLAVAVLSATHPQSGEEIFSLADDEMEVGMGQHGEAGGEDMIPPDGETVDDLGPDGPDVTDAGDDGGSPDGSDAGEVDGDRPGREAPVTVRRRDRRHPRAERLRQLARRVAGTCRHPQPPGRTL